MPDRSVRFSRGLKAFTRLMRELRWIAKGAVSTDHPLMAHIIPIRRCNLSCAYCNEYDDVSKPVPTDVMIKRINRLADLGTGVITLSGGEPLLHPELDEIIAAMRRRGVLAGMITNGYLLTPDRVRKLNDAGLDELQISIDNVMPDDVSKKSLKVLDKKLQVLAEHAAGKLESGIAENKSPLEPADLHLADTEFRHHALGSDRQTLLLEIGDERKCKQEGKNSPANPMSQGV